MGQTVEANGRSILHKGHGTTHAAAPPDVCKTPSPGGPVPIPYPNFAMDSNLASGASSVKIEGNPVANVKSKIAMSTGDEAGTIGGIMSNVFKGTCTWKMGSPNVKAEGECVVRFLDSAFHNGNGFNDVWVDGGKPADGYANDFDDPCPLCKKDPQEHGIPSVASSADVCAEIVKQLKQRYDDNKDRATRNSARSAQRKVQEQANRDLIRARQKPLPITVEDNEKILSSSGNKYMIGVMVCMCQSENVWATMSNETSPGFTDVAAPILESKGKGSPEGNVIQGGAATIQQFAQANRNVPQAATIAELTTRQKNINVALARGDKRYTTFGGCAGAKLLARSGHAPVAMTEMFYEAGNPAKQWTATYTWRNNGVKETGGRTFNAASPSVGSCDSCQETLFLTMCPVRVCP